MDRMGVTETGCRRMGSQRVWCTRMRSQRLGVEGWGHRGCGVQGWGSQGLGVEGWGSPRLGVEGWGTEAGCGRNGSTEVKVWKDWASNSQRAQDLKQEIRMFHGISLPSIVSTD